MPALNHVFRITLSILLLAVLNIPAMPGNAWASGGGEKKSEDGEGDKEKEGKKGKEGGKDKKSGAAEEDFVTGGKFDGDAVYVHLKSMVLPVITDNGAQQIVTIQIDVHVKDMDAATTMQSSMPKTRDAITRALYGGLGDGSLRIGNTLNIPAIKDKVTAALRGVYDPAIIKEVFIQGVAQRLL